MLHQVPAGETTTRTTCPYCGVGCGVKATVSSGGEVAVAGDEAHPANRGRLCAKGASLAETLSLDDRLLHPTIHGQRASWDEALDLVAERFRATVAAHGPDSVAFYVSGQCLTEDYYVANKLMKGFIGSANIDTNSRLCMASAVAGHRRAFGTDTVPGTYEDLELADLVVLVGSNLAWCHPVLHQRLMAAKAARPGMTIVTVDPRRTATADASDLHLALRPGSDVALFAGLLAHLDAAGAVDRAFEEAHTDGFEAALGAARAVGLSGAAEATGLPETALSAFYDLFARTGRVVTAFSQGVNQSASGTDKVNAILNVHLATGRIGKPGASPFSVTGQPNAMGGREVGGLANQLAAHGNIEDAGDRAAVQGFWGAPTIASRPGLKAVDLFRAVREGRVKALWIMATNPVDSVPGADDVAAALKACPFVVVSDVTAETDTAAYAHVLLPAAAWGEKDGTVTNSERRISRQRRFLAPPGEARPDWWALAEVGRRMGFDGFAYDGPAAVFREHAALSAVMAARGKDFDIGGLKDLTDAAFDGLEPVRWPVPAAGGAAGAEVGREAETGGRFFADGRAFTPNGRLRFVATAPAGVTGSPGRPLILNTGRIRDQWHTMTRTGKTARLMGHIAEPFCEIHPADAAAAGIEAATLVRVDSAHGSVVVRALVTDRQQPGTVFVPMHWTDRLAAKGRVDAVVAPVTDPISGQPALKATPVSVAPFGAAWYGFAVSAARPDTEGCDYFAVARAKGGYRTELAGKTLPKDVPDAARRFLRLPAVGGSLTAVIDEGAGLYRFAAFEGERLIGALWIAPEPVAVSRAFAAERLTDPCARAGAVLAGRPGADRPDTGAIVCTCFDVGVRQIEAAVRDGAALTVDAVGAVLKAGTNCGSCRPELRRIIDGARVPVPA
ncbi:nitrate reductase [Chthonobacter rhizosphaerae]|uniref:nitrate reductase n=1 Tax=Chthonobacter rhizosphaerae TaxID=2735553 RepID=UPI0015EF8D49|nr:nitrate reductase [Chthonobacter rhizosphaerae]